MCLCGARGPPPSSGPCRQHQGLSQPPSRLVGSGRDVMAMAKSGQRVRVFLMVTRLAPRLPGLPGQPEPPTLPRLAQSAPLGGGGEVGPLKPHTQGERDGSPYVTHMICVIHETCETTLVCLPPRGRGREKYSDPE